jgi:hypothetical protein
VSEQDLQKTNVANFDPNQHHAQRLRLNFLGVLDSYRAEKPSWQPPHYCDIQQDAHNVVRL